MLRSASSSKRPDTSRWPSDPSIPRITRGRSQRCCNRQQWCFARRMALSTCAILTTGGPMCRAPTGAIREVQTARLMAFGSIPSSTWRTRTSRPMRSGQVKRYRLKPNGKSMCNNWQGEFPWQNLLADGYEWTAPVGSFPANGYGLHEMTGNVWEWTTDWFQDHAKIQHPCCTLVDPRGGDPEHSYDSRLPNIRIPRKVMKGGSYLCAENYCRRYRPAARMAQPVDTAIG